jgi:hypothetical protein
MTILSDVELEDKELWGTSVLHSIIEYLYFENVGYFKKFIKEINVTLDSTLASHEVDLIDGKELHFAPNTTFHAYISHSKMSFEQVQTMAHHMQYFNEKEQLVKVGYMVFSRDVASPVQCEEGELVYVRNTTVIRRYLKTMRGGLDLKNLTWMQNETDMYIITCDKYTKKFSNCRLANHSLDKFDSVSGELQFRTSGKSIGDHVIIGNFVFGCFESGQLGESLARTIITVIGMSLSLLCIAFTLLTYCVFAELRTLPGVLLMNLCTTLIFSQLLFLSAIDKTSNAQTCEIIAIVLHFFWLSTFFWMNAIAFDMMWTFTMKLPLIRNAVHYKTLLHYALYAYGVPGGIVGVSVILERSELFSIGYRPTPGYTKPNCWLSEREGVLYAFIVPVGLLITSNVIFFTITSFSIFWTRKIVHQAKKDPKHRREFLLYIRLFSLMGFTWIIGFIGVFYGHVIIWCLFDMFNSLIGIYIGLSFAVNKRVLAMWRPTGSRPINGPGTSTSSEKLPPTPTNCEKRISLAISTSTPLTLTVDSRLLNL